MGCDAYSFRLFFFFFLGFVVFTSVCRSLCPWMRLYCPSNLWLSPSTSIVSSTLSMYLSLSPFHTTHMTSAWIPARSPVSRVRARCCRIRTVSHATTVSKCPHHHNHNTTHSSHVDLLLRPTARPGLKPRRRSAARSAKTCAMSAAWWICAFSRKKTCAPTKTSALPTFKPSAIPSR